MSNNLSENQEEIFSRCLELEEGLIFLIKETKASDYVTITENKKFTNEDGSFYYKKHKIYVHKKILKIFQIF